MSNALSIIRSLIIYGLCLPLAIFLGYLLAMPMDVISFTIVVMTLFLPLVPAILQWHHFLLIVSWNMSMVLFFLPGRPMLWIVLTAVSFLLSVLQQILQRGSKFIYVSSVARPLILLTIVILITARLTGGIGIRSLGGEAYGGKRYILLLAAIIGFFAISCHAAPPGRGMLYLALYFLSGVSMFTASMAGFVDPSFYFVFTLFPVESVQALFGGGGSDSASGLSRLAGLSHACMAVILCMVAVHGLRGFFSLGEGLRFMPFRFRGGFAVNHPWRLIIFVLAVWVNFLGGYRSSVIMLGLLLLFQFYLEGLFRTHFMPILAILLFLLGIATASMADRLPLNIQRSLSFLPIRIDPVARYSAEASNEWRLQLWRSVLPSVPQYLLLGKGYSIAPSDQVMLTAPGAGTEGAIVAGDLHNGPLTVIIPLGIFGVIGFLWFLWASYRVLLDNWRHGDPELRYVNTFVLAYFLTRLAFFLTIFGSFHHELSAFTGLVAMSICVNGGVRKPAPAPVLARPVFSQFKLARAAR